MEWIRYVCFVIAALVLSLALLIPKKENKLKKGVSIPVELAIPESATPLSNNIHGCI